MENINKGRTKKTYKNMIFGIISRIISLILSFVSRTVFIYYLGKEYLGINGLYTEILNIISVAELGFGTTFTFFLYKPVSENNEEKIKQLVQLLKKIYNYIALIIATIGLLIIPFLPYIIKGAESLEYRDLILYYLFFLINTVINYFVTYKYVFINARMENYYVTILEIITNFIIIVFQFLAIIIFKNYYAYLIIRTFFLVISKIFISIYINKLYPILKEKSNKQIESKDKKIIFKEVRSLALQNISSVAIHSTDNILISMLSGLGIIGVGLVSNYNLIITSVTSFITIILTALTPVFGNIVAISSQDHYREIFYEANFLDFWLYGFVSIAFFILIPPFITLWIGADYLIDNVSFFLIIINCYLQGQSTIYNNARMAKGSYFKDKWVSLIQAILNLLISIIAAKKFGLVGIYIGTIVSRLFFFIVRPIKTYKFLFGNSSKEYFLCSLKYFLIVIFAGFITFIITNLILKQLTIFTFILATFVTALLPNIIIFIFNFKSINFRNLIKRIKLLFINRRNYGKKS